MPDDEKQKNKLGQQIFVRGEMTRSRLVHVIQEMLTERSPFEITVSAIARRAGVSPATFYVYFSDVKDALFHLCETIQEPLKGIVATVDKPWPEAKRAQHVETFVRTYHQVWEANRTLITVRNLEGDLGDDRFFQARLRFGMPLLSALTDRILEGWQKHDKTSHRRAWAQGIVLINALESLYVHPPRTVVPDRPVTLEGVIEAQIQIIMAILNSPC